MTERSGIEIDYCPACRGVWLDRGELDKIIERAAVDARPALARGTPDRGAVDDDRRRVDDRDDRFDDHGRFDDDDDRSGRPRKRRRRESLLGELFDF
jgi:uncharacterized protein